MADIPGLVRSIIETLADDPDAIEISEKSRGKVHVVQLKVSQADMGRIIGREGRVANAVRAVLDAAPGDERWKLEIVD